MSRRAPLVALLALVAAAPALPAAESTVRSYAIEGQGTLELEVPLRWKEDVGWTEGDHRPSIKFTPREGQAFVATVTVLPPPKDAPADFGQPSWLRAVVEDSARRSLGLTEGQDLGLEPIGEGNAIGWYFSVTDKALPDPPPAGAFRVMTQGASAAGNLVLTSTILTQKSWGPELDDALRMLRTARVSDRPADPWRAPGETVQARGALGQRYDLAIPEGFDTEATGPLQLRDRQTGALFTIDVASGTSDVRSELRRLQREAERRSPGQWITRRSGTATLGGKPAAELVVFDELRDEVRACYAVPLEDAVLTATWRVHPSKEKDGAPRLKALLGALTLK